VAAGNQQTWALVAFYSMVGGIIGALAAALPGLIDLLSLKDAAIRKTALIHMSINLTDRVTLKASATARP
jgi:uncharacterized membrane protein